VPKGDDAFVLTLLIFEEPEEFRVDGIPPLPNPPESIMPFNGPDPASNPGKDGTAFILEFIPNATLDFKMPPDLNPPPNPGDGDPPNLGCKPSIEIPPKLTVLLSCMPPTAAAIHCIPFHPSLLMSIASTLPPSIVINNGQNKTNRPQVK
jgi:hypothetical protein